MIWSIGLLGASAFGLGIGSFGSTHDTRREVPASATNLSIYQETSKKNVVNSSSDDATEHPLLDDNIILKFIPQIPASFPTSQELSFSVEWSGVQPDSLLSIRILMKCFTRSPGDFTANPGNLTLRTICLREFMGIDLPVRPCRRQVCIFHLLFS